MTSNHRLQLPACSAVLFLATVLQAGASDGASFVSQTILTNAVMAPGQTFTQTWTMQNTGTTTWSPGASGYTLNLAGTDSLGAVPLFAKTSGTVYLPCATINSGSSVAPGATGTFSMSFIAPETAGTYSDTFQMANASAVSFGPKVGVQIVVQQAGPTGQYDRAKAVSYANNYAAYVCSDGYFWTNWSNYGYYGTGVFTPVPTSSIGDDCAHFVSCCIGSESHQKGGGLTIPTRDANLRGTRGRKACPNSLARGRPGRRGVFLEQPVPGRCHRVELGRGRLTLLTLITIRFTLGTACSRLIPLRTWTFPPPRSTRAQNQSGSGI